MMSTNKDQTRYDPDWTPLVSLVGSCNAEKFMYIGTRGDIRLYKHIISRRYLNVDNNNTTWRYDSQADTYVPVDNDSAILFCLLPDK